MEEEKPPDIGAICDGYDEETNEPCNARLVPTQNFCDNCGKEVDPSIFKVLCKRCKRELQPKSRFCGNCGLKRNKAFSPTGENTSSEKPIDSEREGSQKNAIENLRGNTTDNECSGNEQEDRHKQFEDLVHLDENNDQNLQQSTITKTKNGNDNRESEISKKTTDIGEPKERQELDTESKFQPGAIDPTTVVTTTETEPTDVHTVISAEDTGTVPSTEVRDSNRKLQICEQTQSNEQPEDREDTNTEKVPEGETTASKIIVSNTETEATEINANILTEDSGKKEWQTDQKIQKTEESKETQELDQNSKSQAGTIASETVVTTTETEETDVETDLSAENTVTAITKAVPNSEDDDGNRKPQMNKQKQDTTDTTDRQEFLTENKSQAFTTASNTIDSNTETETPDINADVSAENIGIATTKSLPNTEDGNKESQISTQTQDTKDPTERQEIDILKKSQTGTTVSGIVTRTTEEEKAEINSGVSAENTGTGITKTELKTEDGDDNAESKMIKHTQETEGPTQKQEDTAASSAVQNTEAEAKDVNTGISTEKSGSAITKTVSNIEGGSGNKEPHMSKQTQDTEEPTGRQELGRGSKSQTSTTDSETVVPNTEAKATGVLTENSRSSVTDSAPKNKNRNMNSKLTEAKDSSSRETAESCTVIRFHALLSSEFKFDNRKEIVVICSADDWKDRSKICTTKRIKEKEYNFEVTFDLPFPKSRLQGTVFDYKYTVLKKNGKKGETCESPIGRSKEANRFIYLDIKWKDLGFVDQYDGVIEKPWKPGAGLVYSWKDQCVRHAMCSVEYFCKNILQSEETNPFYELQHLLLSYGQTYVNFGRCWSNNNEFIDAVGGIILREIVKSCKMERGGSPREKREGKVVLALSAIVLCCEFLLPGYTSKEWLEIIEHLVMIPDKNHKRCVELEIMDKHFPGKRSLFCKEFTHLAKYLASKTRNPEWMTLMPWLHFLQEECKPYETPPLDVNHDNEDPIWWGISHLQESVDYFKSKTPGWTLSVEKTLDMLLPMFEMDYLLPRTFVSSLSLQQFKGIIISGKISTEIILASMFYHLRCFINDSLSANFWLPTEKDIVECMNGLVETLKSGQGTRESKVQDEMNFCIAGHLFDESRRVVHLDIVPLSVQIFLNCLSIFHERSNEDNDIYDMTLRNLAICASNVRQWIESNFTDWKVDRCMDNVLLVWNNLYVDNRTLQKHIENEWNQRISDMLEEQLQSQVCNGDPQTTKMYVELYCQRHDMFKGPVQTILNKTAFQAINQGSKLDYTSLKGKQVAKYGELLSNLFLGHFDRSTEIPTLDEKLKYFLEWPVLTLFVDIYAQGNTDVRTALSDDCRRNLKSVAFLFQTVTGNLMNGDIAVDTLNYIQSKSENFTEIAARFQEGSSYSIELIRKAIQVRCLEVQALKRQTELLTTFANFCQQLEKVDLKTLRSCLQQQRDIDKKTLNNFCNAANVTLELEVNDYKPEIILFDVSQQVCNILPELKRNSECHVFKKIWKQECEQNSDNCCTADDVVTEIWQPAKKRWDDTRSKIESGAITFSDFDRLISKSSKMKERTEETLRKMEIADDKIIVCLKQVNKYRQLDQCTDSARAIYTLAECYELPGDFESIKAIAEMEFGNVPINSFDDSLLLDCDFLRKIDRKSVLCINAFSGCVPLVRWIQESMKESGLKELKVFVDLALMSAGDEPLNIARVQCLHSAVTGYAPLIFELFKFDQKLTYRELIEKCTVVCKELEVDPKLPDKLTEASRYLDWFQDIQKAHGSVEVTSLMQAETINESGTYTLGKSVWKRGGRDQRSDETTLKVEDVLTLRVPELRKGNYSFSQLQDLQSRLMLVAGEADNTRDSVDTFTSVFDSLTRLSNVYIKLWSSGCLLFKEFSATFRCSEKKPVCVRLNFGEEKQSLKLEGERSENENLKEIIPEIARFLEACHKEWLQHFQEKRKHFPYLNFFTVDQLVILQQELIKVGKMNPSHFIYPLLSAVKENCSPDDLMNALLEAKKEIEDTSKANETKESEEMVSEEPETPKVDETDTERQKFIEEMKDLGFTEEIALSALKFVKPDDIAGGMLWCCENNAKTDKGIAKGTEDVEAITLAQSASVCWSETATDLQELVKSKLSKVQQTVGSKPLLEVLHSLWRTFLESLSSNIRDYLSLEHLGIILKHLALQGDLIQTHRTLPAGLKEGQPNLIVCPSADVLLTTLTVYSRQPLPKSDEVLLCSADTTNDEVDIFLRRALFGNVNKVHCLANVDRLAYDVSEAAERLLQCLLLDVKEGTTYRLLVICGSENEYKSGIASSLDKFKRPCLPVKVSHLKGYIAHELKINSSSLDVTPAAAADKERCSVRVVKSWRAGVGKSLYKERQAELVKKLNDDSVKKEAVSIPLHGKNIDFQYLIGKLLKHTIAPDESGARLFHIDIYHEVQNGVDELLFNLLILGYLVDKKGYVWRKSPADLYLIETMPLMTSSFDTDDKNIQYFHRMLQILPDMTCRSPLESRHIYHDNPPGDFSEMDQLFDHKQFDSPVFQRPFQYLLRFDEKRPLTDVNPSTTEGSEKTCLETLLRHCGLENPSWSELHSFAWFLNTQLADYENNAFVGASAQEDLPGFAKFVLLFLIQMSRDFSTRSLNISEESPDQDRGQTESKPKEVEDYQMRRTWESSPHPYLFFNKDRCTFTFLGFNIERYSGNLIDLQTKQILQKSIMKKDLYDGLVRNQVDLQEDFDALTREEKIRKLCNVMGVEYEETIPDPDDTYELTTDNVKKIMAIYMRFRCNIPVIIMGETGCGKTRLVKFMCDLLNTGTEDTRNMIIMKVHGGTTHEDIIDNVMAAEKIAKKNKDLYTVLFFDEANTTEAIGLIKEIMCDKTLMGEKMNLCENLKIVAACNPYRKHSEELIKKLEQAGLGYHVDADETSDRFGRVPMRRLVYRVQPLPQSLLPLVWDFGQLSTDVEDLYIRQMVRRYIRDGKLPDVKGLKEALSAVLTESQYFMRKQKDECSFVSLRDVDRVLTVMSWFYKQSKAERTLFNSIDKKLNLDSNIFADADHDSESEMEQRPFSYAYSDGTEDRELDDDNDVYDILSENEADYEMTEPAFQERPSANVDSDEEMETTVTARRNAYIDIDQEIESEVNTNSCTGVYFEEEVKSRMKVQFKDRDLTRSLILAIGVCYHACLKKRSEYREYIKDFFKSPCALQRGADQILEEIETCQEVFLDNVHLEKNIARNMALKENLFMMVVCVELRIPLFLVGKPGSSKSLAKTIVADSLQGSASREELFRQLKKVQMVSFQCSPLSTPDGIVGTFRQCAQFQRGKDLSRYVSVVVLDEVGLAEDSPKMPLKTLHPLLEDGCQENETLEDNTKTPEDECQGNKTADEYQKVAFIGISNWALDPAKMNRGILVQREVPNLTELQNSAKGICSSDEDVGNLLANLIEPMAKSYREIFENATRNMREFYGLRDFYSLVKMVYSFAENASRPPTWNEMQHAIKRNFGGLDSVDAEKIFRKNVCEVMSVLDQSTHEELDNSPAGLIEECLFGSKTHDNRYLLLLTENYGALTIIQQKILTHSREPITIFGSSFISDQEYTQVCRNINKIKVCMETDSTVVLLNLENLYESLYDALNQHYEYFGGERYVDLGLGTHRVKCPVHEGFRLIVVAEKQTVYEKFPIPLINRLEKHFLTINTMLTPVQQEIVRKLEHWLKRFVHNSQPLHVQSKDRRKTKPGDVIIGYHDDACPAIVIDVCEKKKQADNEDTEKTEKEILEAAKSALLWCVSPEALVRLENTSLPTQDKKDLQRSYFEIQTHDNLLQYLHEAIVEQEGELRAQVTTHSKLMANAHRDEIGEATGIPAENVLIVETLSSFETEQQFTNKIRDHIQRTEKTSSLMTIQCDSGDVNANLVACARYCVRNEIQKIKNKERAKLHVVFVVQLPRGANFTGFQCGVWQSAHIDDLYPDDMDMPRLHDMWEKSIADIFKEAVMTNEEESFVSDQTKKKKVNVRGLVLRCVQAALSMVKNKDGNTSREMNRVSLVRNLLHREQGNGRKSFMYGVCCLLHKLLEEKEATVQGKAKAKNWLIEDAASQESISKSGTFRRSCLKTLENKVSPILAMIIAYLDTNDNLSLLEGQTSTWKQELWLAVLNITEAQNLRFSDLQSPSGHSQLKEVEVKSTGCGDTFFSAKLPFSWLLIEKVNEVIKKHQPGEDSYRREVNVLRKDQLGAAVSRINKEQEVSEFVADYIEDFVHTIYSASSEQEHEVVVWFFVDRGDSLEEMEPDTDLINRIVKVHLTHRKFAARLHYFRTINSIWPECSSVLAKKKKSQQPFEAKDIAFTMLNILLEELYPKTKVFNRADGRADWLEMVHKCQPVVEEIISFYSENLYIQEEGLQQARIQWSHIKVVKLYLEHLCTASSDEKVQVAFCFMLLQKLHEPGNENLKNSLRGIEEFLEKYNSKAMEQNGFAGQCGDCKMTLDGPPNALPCGEVVCDGCLGELISNEAKVCPKCQVEFPEKWEPVQSTNNEKSLEEMRASQRRCNTFFMNVVSQISFADNTAPAEEVVNRLLHFVFFTAKGGCQRTREFTIFKTGGGLDPNPVFRSFLLQLLARTSEHDLKSNLELYLRQAKPFINQDTPEDTRQYVELCVLVIQCLEDMLTAEAQKRHTDEQHLGLEAFDKARLDAVAEGNIVETLYSIVNARVGLSVLAKCLSAVVKSLQMHGTDEEGSESLDGVICLVRKALSLFENTGITHLRSFLVKVICRNFGVQVYKSICQTGLPELQWINFMDIEKVVEIPDRYIICGTLYADIRESLTKALLEGNAKRLEETTDLVNGNADDVEAMLKLAVYREVTCANLCPERKLSKKSLQRLQSFIATFEILTDKDFFQALLQNQMSPKHLVVEQGEDLRHQGIQCLLVHFLVVMTHNYEQESLTTPIRMLMRSPDLFRGKFLPTMPQDDLEEIKMMFRHEERDSFGFKIDQYDIGQDRVVFYRCPNGHAYSIGECGNPSAPGLCPECGAAIGGVVDDVHALAEGNTKDVETASKIQTGHILGYADSRGEDPKAERTMTTVNCRLIRLLVHMAMYTAIRDNAQDIGSIISPEIGDEQVVDFVWDHIQRDICDLQQGLDRSEDDVFLLVHCLLNNIMSKPQTGQQLSDAILRWSTKDGRQLWEEQFSAVFLLDLLQDLQNTLQAKNKLLARDQRLGGNKLQCMLWEVEDTTEEETVDELKQCPSVWRFRPQVSLAHLRQEVMSLPQDKHKVLKVFMQEEHYLRCLRYIPSILRLHRVLFEKYQRQLDKTKAFQITVASLKDEIETAEIHRLIKNFSEAWELLRQTVKRHRCQTDYGAFFVPPELCDACIKEDTPISVLLPTTEEAGLCSFALLDFLFRKQNEVLDKYLAETERTTVSTVKPKDITSAHLISYDPQYDIKPILLANCQYSFEMGKGTTIQYDFAGLERQLIDRFLFAKSKVAIDRVLEIDLMVYRTELTNADVFDKLKTKIPQEVLSATVKAQINNESRSLPDLCQSLNNLDITISFLTSTGGPPEAKLHDFMSETLQMETTIHSNKAQQTCKFKHTMSLWLLLALQKSKLMTERRQHSEAIFETVSVKFHEDLSDNAKDSLREYTKRLSADKRALLLEALHEYLLLRLAVRQQQDEDDADPRDKILKVWMLGSVEEDSVLEEILANFPPDILNKHSVHTWMFCYDLMREKLNGNSTN